MSKSQALFTKSESVKKIVLNNRQKTTLTSIMDEVKLVSSILTGDITPTNIVLYLEEFKELNNLLIIQYKAELIQDYVDANVYDGLMDHITQEEIEYHISLLLNEKAQVRQEYHMR
ncbi:unnamed protein product [Rhizophagus irregularis]|nr:unnamed protein product [Rhizophagus irregularis]